jgi:trehalose 6-phosphate phosphatase
LFLDVDGTLLELTDTPLATHADDDLKSLLGRVAGRLHGALALVSGRSIEYLDALFAPLDLPIAGLHGVERRSAAGALERSDIDPSHLDHARASLSALVAAHPGTLLEDKGRTVAVHFRLAPHAEAVVRQFVTGIVGGLGARYHAQDGNMMIEIKPRGFSKGDAIAAFMREAPFAGKRPVFIGDDLTDLDGFAAVESHGGISIGVGDRVRGQYQLADPAAVRAWLARIAIAA